MLRESRDPAGGRPDWVGTALITAALTALMFALIRGNAVGRGSPTILALLAAAAVAFAGFVFYELRIAAAPMADLHLSGRRSFAATGFVAFVISATVIGMIIYLSLYVQNTLGYSPIQAGLRFLPLSLTSFAVALVTGRLIGRVGMRVGSGDRTAPGLPPPRDEVAPSGHPGSTPVGEVTASPRTIPVDEGGGS
jgi:hypothetical protein